jgi:hypothetical protein
MAALVIYGLCSIGREEVPSTGQEPEELVVPSPLESSRVFWMPAEGLEAMAGGWRSPDGAVLVQLYETDPDAASYWQLDVDRMGGYSERCGLYEGCCGDPPWWMGSCREEGVEPAIMRSVRMWHVPGTDKGRLVVEGLVSSEIVRLE